MPGRQTIPRPDTWELAPGPTWRTDLTLADVTGRPPVAPVGSLPDLPVGVDPVVAMRRSAVLVTLCDRVPGQPGTNVLVTRRASDLRAHAGEVSFPGGRVDPGETTSAAALREAWEEVALPPEAVAVVGELPHLMTAVSASYIVPIVGVVAEPVPMTLSAAEVDAAYWVPLDGLVAAGVHHRERWRRERTRFDLEFFELPDDTIWGATARMLVTLLSADAV